MQQLILCKDIEQAKMDALLNFLKLWDIEAELKSNTITKKNKSDFNLSAGIWKDYEVRANELRTQAWSRNK